MDDILGQAIYDHHNGDAKNKLWIYNQYGRREAMPIDTYFRAEDDMPDMEWMALNECRGRVLDIGAGAGSHALALQMRNTDVTALDISPLLAKVMHSRGVKNVVETNIYTYADSTFDTLLLLMNGIGLAGTLSQLELLLIHFKSLINPGGQILFDSSDVSYLFGDEKPTEHYYGEIAYQYGYNDIKTNWFNWLYIDEHTMQHVANKYSFKMEVLLEDEYGQYLARLTL